jgi:DNA-binding transcriptional regulator YiaG
MRSTFGNKAMDQTSPYTNRAGSVVWIPLTIMLGIGTGEVLTQHVCKLRATGERFNYHSHDNGDRAKAANFVTPADDIAHIRAVLKTSVADLAHCIGVSRQSMYNWKSGTSIKSQNLSKLAQLKAAANVLLAEDIHRSPLVLERKLPGGKTLLESITDGADGYTAAMSLVNMLREEAAQQTMLDKRLAARLSGASRNPEYGVPAFDERG